MTFLKLIEKVNTGNFENREPLFLHFLVTVIPLSNKIYSKLLSIICIVITGNNIICL